MMSQKPFSVGDEVTLVQRGRSPRSVRISSATSWRLSFDFPEALQKDTAVAFEREDGSKVRAQVARSARLAGGRIEITAELCA